MFHLIWRQRRRLAFGGFFLALAVALRLRELQLAATFDVTPAHWIALARDVAPLLGMIVLCALAIIVFIPWMRVAVEMAPLLTFLGHSLGLKDMPAVWFGLGPSSEYLVLIGLLVVLYGASYGVWLDRCRIGFAMFSTRRARLDIAPETLWTMIAAQDPDTAGRWDPILHDVRTDEDDPDRLKVRYVLGPSVFLEQAWAVTARQPPHRFGYRFSGEAGARNRALTQGTCEAIIEPDGHGGSHVTITERYKSMLPRVTLSLWFDDHCGDGLDGARARLEGRRDWSNAGRGQRKILELS